MDIAELSTVIHAELIRAGLADLSPTLLAAALRLLASDICEDYPTAEQWLGLPQLPSNSVL